MKRKIKETAIFVFFIMLGSILFSVFLVTFFFIRINFFPLELGYPDRTIEEQISNESIIF